MKYARAELKPWAEHIQTQASSGRFVYDYFNNDLNVRAPANAKLLMEMTGAEQAWSLVSKSGVISVTGFRFRVPR